MRESRLWFWLIVFLISTSLVYLLAPILTPFLTAALLAYMGSPLLNYLAKWKIPRTLAVVLVFLIIIAVILSLLLLLIPMLENQIKILLARLPDVTAWLQERMVPWLSERFGIKEFFSADNLTEVLKTHWQQAGGIAASILKTISQSGLVFVGWLANIVLIPVVTFYLLRDWDKVLKGVRQLIPRAQETTIVSLATEGNEVVGAFFRGQLLVMLALGIIYSIGLWVAGLNLALLIGLIAGLVSIVPYLGLIVGLAFATIAAFFQFHDWLHILYVWLAFGVGQTLESAVLTPLLVGDRIGLHPVAVIFAILAGGQLFGFVGILLALPVAAVLMVVVRHMKQQYIASNVYQTNEK